MAWTTPVTFVDGNVLTAAQLNTHVRDNMLETSPAKATNTLQWFVSQGANSLIGRQLNTVRVVASETTSSTSFADLSTVGPSITVTTGTRAIVIWSADMSNSSASETTASLVGIAISGATTTAASDTSALRSITGGGYKRAYAMAHAFTLTAGSNTFKMRYRVTAGSGSFANRELIVIPF